jgi:hypothetical protein
MGHFEGKTRVDSCKYRNQASLKSRSQFAPWGMTPASHSKCAEMEWQRAPQDQLVEGGNNLANQSHWQRVNNLFQSPARPESDTETK